MASPFQPIQASDSELNGVQNNLSAAFSKLFRNWPILDGVLVSGVVLATGKANSVPHGLGRKPNGYIVVSANAAAKVYNDSVSDALADRVLSLRTDAAVTVSLWVF